jgi:hypothetical protein
MLLLCKSSLINLVNVKPGFFFNLMGMFELDCAHLD